MPTFISHQIYTSGYLVSKYQYSYTISLIIATFIALFAVNYTPQIFTADYNDNAILVNDGAIKRIDYLTAVSMMEDEKTYPMQRVDYQLIVDRLTEEELLFQYGVSQGIIFQPQISQLIVNNLLETISIQHTSKEYSDAELYNLYQKKIASQVTDDQQLGDLAFENIKDDFANALRQIARNKAVRDYLLWLRNRSAITETDNINSEKTK